jgi:hypothetical protein
LYCPERADRILAIRGSQDTVVTLNPRNTLQAPSSFLVDLRLHSNVFGKAVSVRLAVLNDLVEEE